jgi:cyclic dehypoxanthinyl futalosine synthase
MEADAVRRRLHPEGMVSYAIDGVVDCAAAMSGYGGFGSKLAAGSAHPLWDAIGETIEMGGSGVRLVWQDGREWVGWLGMEAIFRTIKRQFPTVWIEALSAAEIVGIVGHSGIGTRETLARLKDAGLDSIAGDGPDLRESFAEWAGVHRAAHEAGMQTAAAMVFGGGESVERRVDFLEGVRRLQEETGGFTAFIPVSAEAPNGRELDGVTAVERLKTLAISRMFLDNVENVQASWAGQGLKVLQMGLRFGANDVGSAGVAGGGSEEDLRRIIRDAGFRPVQRDTLYRTMFLN